MKELKTWAFVLVFALAGQAYAADGGPPSHYTGTAVDDKGQPVAGATVECYQDSSPVSAYTAQDFALKERGTTDSKGGFSVSAGEGVTIVVVKKEGLAPGWRTFASVLGESSEPVVLTGLATPARSEVDTNGQLITYTAPVPYALAGRVVDENDQPAGDAEVWVSLAMPSGGGFSQSKMILGKPAQDCFSARTSADGRFRIASFPGNTQADLAVHKAGMALSRPNDNFNGLMLRVNNRTTIGAAPPYISGMQESLSTPSVQHEIMPYTSGQLGILLKLEPAGNIEGKVTVQGTGEPLPGVKLLPVFSGKGLAGMEMAEAVGSGADGSFRMADVRPGMVNIAAVFSGEPVADWVVSENIVVTVIAGETAKNVKIPAGKGEMSAITVLERRGRSPLANVIVTASANGPGGRAPGTSVTGPDGVAQLRLSRLSPSITGLLPDQWNVIASKEGWNDGRAVLRIEPGQTDGAEILLDWHYRITGIVRDPSGVPVAGAIISLNLGAGNNNAFVKTDANGRYVESWQVFAGGNQQSFTLLARSVERHLAVIHPIDASTTNLDLNLQPGVTLIAKVQDATGKPVTNAAGWLLGMNSSGRLGALGESCKSDLQGRIEFADMPPEDGYQVNVSAEGHGYAIEKVSAPNRQTNRLAFPTILLPLANLKLAGQVLNKDGSPAAGILLNCSGQNQPSGSTHTDSEGRFSFDSVCAGPMQITVAQGSFGSFPAVGGDTNVILRLMQDSAKQGLNITGTLRDPAGAPVAGATVTVYPNTYRNPEVKTDASGRYEIKWRLFHFDNLSYFLVARSAEQNLALIHQIDDSATNLDLSLEPGVTLSGKVQDARGKPVTNAVGRVGVMNGLVWFGPGYHSDAEGRMEITDMPRSDGYALNITAEGYGNGYPRIPSAARQTNRLEFPTVVLPLANQKLTGTVFDTDGKPAAGVRVKVWGDSVRVLGDSGKTGEVQTDSDGRYLIGWQKQNWGGTVWSPFIFARDLEHNLAVSHDIDDTTTNQDLTLQPGLTLSVKVQDMNGKPIPTATETLTVWSGLAEFQFNQIPYRADDQGMIEITALPQGRHYSAAINRQRLWFGLSCGASRGDADHPF
jgi:hypothetical protein